MNPHANELWKGPRWTLALLLACLGMVGPFSIDAYLPAFQGIAAAIHATPVEMQQTLSAYLLGFAVANLFHGALSDSWGRRPVVLLGVGLFTVASAGCALAPHIGALIFWRVVQGVSAGAGIVVSRAVIRDLFPPSEAQKVMSQVTIYFGIAPAIAPMVGGFLFVHAGWTSIFWLLTVLGAALWWLNWMVLPETLDPKARQPFHLKPLLRAYKDLVLSRRFLALCVASGVPFNGMFLYILAAPAFLGDVLGLPPQHFFWFFMITISGVMGGAWCSGRLAGRIKPRHQVRHGFLIMIVVSLVNVLANAIWTPHVAWAMWPVGLFAFGWALMVPVVTLMVLDEAPQRRGMASSLHSCIGSVANAVVAGLLVPWVMHSGLALAVASLGTLLVGLLAWLWVYPQLPR